MTSPHEGSSEDDLPEDGSETTDAPDEAGEAALGRYWRTYRQRRNTLAPYVCAMFGGSITITIALIAEEGPLFDSAWRIALLLIPLGAVVGVLYNHFAPVDLRARVDVHEHGVRLVRGEGRPVVCVPARVITVANPAMPDEKWLALWWPLPGGMVTYVRLDAFGSSRSLRRALVDREFTPDPRRKRVVASVVAAVVLVPFYAWLLIPRPLTVPEEYEHLHAFCEDEEMVFTGLPAYEGEGPHHLTVVSENRYPTAVEVAGSTYPGAQMADRGWSTEMEDAVLIACGGPDLGEELDTCTYTASPTGFSTGDDTTVPLHAARFEYDLYEAATHRHVAAVEVAGTPVEDWECPSSIREDKNAALVEHDLTPVVDAFAPYVEGRPGG